MRKEVLLKNHGDYVKEIDGKILFVKHKILAIDIDYRNDLLQEVMDELDPLIDKKYRYDKILLKLYKIKKLYRIRYLLDKSKYLFKSYIKNEAKIFKLSNRFEDIMDIDTYKKK